MPIQACLIIALAVVLTEVFKNVNLPLANIVLAICMSFGLSKYNHPFARNSETQALLTMVYAKEGSPKSDSIFYFFGSEDREQLFLKIAKDFGEDNKPSTVVLAPENGAIGYATDVRSVSSIGHINPEVVDFFIANQDVTRGPLLSEELVEFIDPDYIVSLDIFFTEGFLETDIIRNRYEIISAYDSTSLKSKKLYALKKRKS